MAGIRPSCTEKQRRDCTCKLICQHTGYQNNIDKLRDTLIAACKKGVPEGYAWTPNTNAQTKPIFTQNGITYTGKLLKKVVFDWHKQDGDCTDDVLWQRSEIRDIREYP